MPNRVLDLGIDTDVPPGRGIQTRDHADFILEAHDPELRQPVRKALRKPHCFATGLAALDDKPAKSGKR
jgi:hypothetical protein